MSSFTRRTVRAGLAAVAAASVLATAAPSWATSDSNVSAGSQASSRPGKNVFDHRGFVKPGSLSLNGSAKIVRAGGYGKGRVLRLTDGGFQQAGSAWSSAQIDPRRSFTTTFDVSLRGDGDGADGVAFVLQPGGLDALGGAGGGLGFSGQAPSVAVEFDIHRGSDDPDRNHVGVVNNGRPQTHLVTVRAPFALFGTPFRATVRYDAQARELTVWASPLSRTSSGEPLVKHGIDLATVLGADSTYVGFTGATGAETAVQDILRWQLSA